ncbi:MAG: hypothetical protein KBS69_00335, partial [Bacteroidales bacterium]|nr:hypothetical protein [Candidatus Colicola caccequi]
MTYVGEDTIQALDTVRFELAISKEDTVLTAIKLGRPAPAARKEFVFVAGEAAASDPALFAITWGKDGSNETVKLANKADDMYTAEILETVDSVVLVRCATGATEIIWDGEGKNVWNQTANYELCDTMSFVAWVEETNLFAVTCEAPQPVEDKFYVTGNAALVGEEKAWKADAIEMTNGAYTFTALPAGEYEMKITNGAWDPEGRSWGSAALSEECSAGVGDKDGNVHFIVETPNDVNVAIAEGKVTVTGTFKQEPVDEGYGILLNGTDYIKGEASDIDGGKEYKVVLDLNIGDFVQLYDGAKHVAWVVDPEGSGYTNFDQHDNALYIKENGNYQFYVKIFTDATSGLYVGFTSDPTGLIEIMRNAKDGKFIINGNMIIRRNGALYTIQGARL